MAVKKIFVGYRTRAVEPELLEALTPEFAAARNLKDKEKIRADIEERRDRFLASAADQPYTGTFDAVVLLDPAHKAIRRWSYEDRGPGGPKPRIAVALAEYVLGARRYRGAWAGDLAEPRKPEAIFLGFGMRRFLKMWGEECSLPEVGRPLPPRLWYDNSDHRDIEEAVLPRDFKDLTLATALRRRRPVDPAAAGRWDALLDGWTGPHRDPEKDLLLAVELAYQLGFLHRDEAQ